MGTNFIPEWTNDYVGIPFEWDGEGREGVNCWTLVRLILLEQFGREFSMHSTDVAGAQNGKAVEESIRIGECGWKPVDVGVERAGDVVVMNGIYMDEDNNARRAACHVGIVVAPGWMLHAELGIDTVLVEYRKHPTTRRRIVEVMRYEG